MPGGKLRLKGLFTGGQQVGGTGTYVKHVLAGSVVVEAPSINQSVIAGSSASVFATISGLTASHIMVARVVTGNACTVLGKVLSGAGSANFTFQSVAGCGAGLASQTTTTINYLAFQV